MSEINQQKLADAREVVIAGMLMVEGYTVSRPLSGATRYDLVAEKEGKFVKIQVKSLKLDTNYKNSPLPYSIYLLEAYSFNPVRRTNRGYTRQEVDLVVGYNHEVKCFAAVPLDKFEGRLSGVVHEKEGLRSEYFNTWRGLEEVLSEI